MVLLSLIPQIHLWLVRGRNWNGAYVSSQGDEFLYSAYINALIDGRTRKNDPSAGKDDTPKSPLPESTFSIQFVPSYAISFLARAFRASASSTFIALICVTGFLASLSIFWLLRAVLCDDRLAAAGTIFILCFGGLAGGSGLLGILLNSHLGIPMLPFLRRYQPAAAFPLFFVFNMLAWRSLTNQVNRWTRIHMVLAGLTLVLLIFSYLYLWTAAAAWLLTFAALFYYFRPADWRRTSAMLVIIGTITAVALVPYAYLVSHRAPTLDEQQTLALGHKMDLFRVPEILGMFILVGLSIGVWRGKIQAPQSRVIYAASLALLPFLVFNQQILTGKSMQPHHFALFVANYAALLGVVLCVAVLWKTISVRVLVWIAALSFSWGLIEVALPARLASVPAAVTNDEMIPVLLRLKELSNQDGTLAGLRGDGRIVLVFSPNIHVSVLLPTWTSQGTLLDMGGLDFGSVSGEERKGFFLMHLYYSKADVESLRDALTDKTDDHQESYYSRSVIFGHERVLPVLSYQFQPIQSDEIEREVRAYAAYANSFSRAEALKRPIAYAVGPASGDFDFANLDRWYERDAGERVGNYTLYRLKMRN